MAVENTSIPLTVLTEMDRSLHLLKDSSRVLVSASLDQWLRNRLKEQYALVHEWPNQWKTPSGPIFYKGVPVIVCEQLDGHEYAFVS